MEYLTDPQTGEVVPITDNGGSFRSDRFARFIKDTPELDHVHTRVRSPGQNGVRERAFGALKYERLNREDIADMHDLVARGEEHRVEFNTVRPHEALSWNRPRDAYLGLAAPDFPSPKTCHFLDTGQLWGRRVSLVAVAGNESLARSAASRSP